MPKAGGATEPEPDPEAALCKPGREKLCLLDGRLSVEVSWRTLEGVEGVGQAIVDTDNTGFFWFFNIENTELVVKILDGGELNGRLWLFYGAFDRRRDMITVRDTATGATQVHHNPPGEVCGRADLEAFISDPDAQLPITPPVVKTPVVKNRRKSHRFPTDTIPAGVRRSFPDQLAPRPGISLHLTRLISQPSLPRFHSCPVSPRSTLATGDDGTTGLVGGQRVAQRFASRLRLRLGGRDQ